MTHSCPPTRLADLGVWPRSLRSACWHCTSSQEQSLFLRLLSVGDGMGGRAGRALPGHRHGASGRGPPIPQTAMKVSIQTQFSRWGNRSSKQHQDIGLGVIPMCMSMQAHTHTCLHTCTQACMHTHTHMHTSSTWLQDQPTDRSHFPDLETQEMGGGQGSHLLLFVQSIGRRQLHLGLLCPTEDPRQWRCMDEGQGPGVKKESGD